MNCGELVERVTDYLEGALHLADTARLQAHLRACLACDRYLGELVAVLRLTAGVPPEPLSAQLESRLLAAYRGWAESVSR